MENWNIWWGLGKHWVKEGRRKVGRQRWRMEGSAGSKTKNNWCLLTKSRKALGSFVVLCFFPPFPRVSVVYITYFSPATVSSLATTHHVILFPKLLLSLPSLVRSIQGEKCWPWSSYYCKLYAEIHTKANRFKIDSDFPQFCMKFVKICTKFCPYFTLESKK